MTVRKGIIATMFLGLSLYGGWLAQENVAHDPSAEIRVLREIIVYLEKAEREQPENEAAMRALLSQATLHEVAGRQAAKGSFEPRLRALNHLWAHIILYRDQHQQALPISLQQLRQAGYVPLSGLTLTKVRFEYTPDLLTVTYGLPLKQNAWNSSTPIPSSFTCSDSSVTFTVEKIKW